MKYKIPLYSSFAFTLIGLALIYFNYLITSQIFLIIAFLFSFGAFKTRGVLISAIAHCLPGIILATLYFTPGQFPFLSLAIILSSFQNIFLEMVFPGKMYNSPFFKIVIALISISFYLLANILYPSGVSAWVFPGIVLLLVNLLSFLVVTDVFKIKNVSQKGCINVGAPCPEFNLPDEEGKLISLSEFKGKYLLMVFVRGDWCPGCHIMLRCYEKNREKFAARGVNLLSIGPDPLGVNKNMVQKLGLHYHILSDEKQMLARQFCVELQEVGSGIPDYDFVPLPASFLIDKQGIVRYTSRADKAGEILYPDQIFQILDSLN
jgi:thioredoxin-dependent peroxiredoxin